MLTNGGSSAAPAPTSPSSGGSAVFVGGGSAASRQVELAPFQLFIPQDNTSRLCFEADKVYRRYKGHYQSLKQRILAGEKLPEADNMMFLALLPLRYACTSYLDLDAHYKMWMERISNIAKNRCCCLCCCNIELAESCVNRYPDGVWCFTCPKSVSACMARYDCRCWFCCDPFDKSEYNVVLKITEQLMPRTGPSSFYLIHKSHILQADNLLDLMFELIEPKLDQGIPGKLVKFDFSKYPRYTFVSHKWYGNLPDNDEKKFFQHLRHLADVIAEEFFWIDWCCFPQIWDKPKETPKHLEVLRLIPRILLGASHVELFRQNTGYQQSVWCAMEAVTTVDDGFLKHYSFQIQNLSDFENVFPPLWRMCIQFTSLRSIIEQVHNLEAAVRTGPTNSRAKAELERLRQEIQDIIDRDALFGPTISTCCGYKKKWWLGSPLLWTKNPVMIQLCLYYFMKYESVTLDPEEMIREPKREKIGQSVVPKYGPRLTLGISASDSFL